LTVIKRVYPNNKYNHSKWLCRCDCGKEKNILGSSLIQGNTKSCGCIRFGQRFLPIGLASLREAFRKYRQTARMRGHIFNLTEKQFKEITQQDCHYCGARPDNVQKSRYHNGDYTYNGLDRVENAKGYTMDNVVPCCIHCNRAKNSMTLKEFKELITRIYKKVIE